MSQATDLEGYLRQQVSCLLPCRPAVQQIGELAPQVWLVEALGGAKVVAKHQIYGSLTRGRAWDLLVVEKTVLDLLQRAHCAVPQVLGMDSDRSFIFFSYGGPSTLDDLVQERLQPLGPWALRIVAAFNSIEGVLRRHQACLERRCAPGAEAARLAGEWRQAGRRAQAGLAYLGRHCGADLGPLPQLLGRIVRRLGRRRPTMASADYNARNIVVDSASGQLCFIEFAKLGWDWPERRLVQYSASLGGHRRKGVFRSILDPEAVQAYAYGAGRRNAGAALDGHHLVFYLNAAAMLGAALTRPQQSWAADLLRAWDRPQERLGQLIQMVGSSLSRDPLMDSFRASFRQYCSVHFT
ncbi:MAG: hypothetical protein GKR89_08565 [Candidatus Latescibacteria bacterium]|nr:hypothetical protein [Candidatus Latescibacterota bacterium]